jgi:hypothetical protein
MIVWTKSFASGERSTSASVAPVNAVTGLSAPFPISVNQI